MTNSGFIMLPRSIMDSQFFTNKTAVHFYLVLFGLARYKEQVCDGYYVGVNQILTTKKKLSELSLLSEREVRYYLEKFRDMGALTFGSVKNRYTLITVHESFLDGSFAHREEKKENIIHPEITVYKKKKDKNEKKNEEMNTNEKGDNLTSSPDTKEPCLSEIKNPYGKFGNVFLTLKEYEELKHLTPNYEYYIERLSASLMNTAKSYDNHFALLCKNILEDTERNRIQKTPEPITPDPTASYDIRRAEERARTSVPKLKKREKR